MEGWNEEGETCESNVSPEHPELSVKESHD